MHKNDDVWRQLFIQKQTANPKHPYHRFSIGTLKTLGKVDHKSIKKFYKSRYSANLMAAAVYTNLPLDAAEKLVNEQFSKIPDRKLPIFHAKEPLQDPKLEGSVVWQKKRYEYQQYQVDLATPQEPQPAGAKQCIEEP
jgi:secreted Zn-dependent insulinase-like peptidase